MNSNIKTHMQNLIAEHQRRLRFLRETSAKLGMSAGPEIQIEIEDIESELKVLQEQLKQLKESKPIDLSTLPELPDDEPGTGQRNLWLVSTNNKQRYRLGKGSTTIGRTRRADIKLQSNSVSPEHAIIEFDGQTCTIQDEESLSGTFINGQKIGRERVLLKPGDELKIGDQIFNLRNYYSGSSVSPPSPPWIIIGVVAGLIIISGLGGWYFSTQGNTPTPSPVISDTPTSTPTLPSPSTTPPNGPVPPTSTPFGPTNTATPPEPPITPDTPLPNTPTSPPDGGDEALNRIKQAGKITVGVRYDAPPFGEAEGWLDTDCDPTEDYPDFKPEGYDIEIAREFAYRWFKDRDAVQFRCVRGTDRIDAVRRGDVSIGIFSLSKVPAWRCDPSVGVECSRTYMVDGLGVLVNDNSGITQLCDSKIKTVAVVTATSALFGFEEGFKEFCDISTLPELLPPFNIRLDAINPVISGTISAYATNVEILKALEKKYPELMVVPGEFGQEEFGVAVTPGDTALLELINKTIQEMENDGTLTTLKDNAGFKCIPGPIPEPSCPSPGMQYRVLPGDTLSGIARQAYGDYNLYHCIASKNNIDNPRNLQADTLLDIPERTDCQE